MFKITKFDIHTELYKAKEDDYEEPVDLDWS